MLDLENLQRSIVGIEPKPKGKGSSLKKLLDDDLASPGLMSGSSKAKDLKKPQKKQNRPTEAVKAAVFRKDKPLKKIANKATDDTIIGSMFTGWCFYNMK